MRWACVCECDGPVCVNAMGLCVCVGGNRPQGILFATIQSTATLFFYYQPYGCFDRRIGGLVPKTINGEVTPAKHASKSTRAFCGEDGDGKVHSNHLVNRKRVERVELLRFVRHRRGLAHVPAHAVDGKLAVVEMHRDGIGYRLKIEMGAVVTGSIYLTPYKNIWVHDSSQGVVACVRHPPRNT